MDNLDVARVLARLLLARPLRVLLRLRHLLLQLHFLEEVVGVLLSDRVVARHLGGRLCVAGRLGEVVGWLAVALGETEHVLHLDVLQVALDHCLLLVMARRQARVQKLLRGLAWVAWLVLRQIGHCPWSDPLRGAEGVLLELLDALEMLLLLLQGVLGLLGRRVGACLVVTLFLLGVTAVEMSLAARGVLDPG